MVRLQELAELVGGDLRGDADIVIAGFCSLENPKPEHIAFMEPAPRGRIPGADELGALLTTPGLARTFPTVIVTDSPRLAFVRVMEYFLSQEPEKPAQIDPSAHIDDSAQVGRNVRAGALAVVEEGASLGESCEVGAGCYVGPNARIGACTKLYPHVSILANCQVGSRCIIHSGTVIGSDGFGFVTTPEGRRKFPQVGTVVIEDDVEIGACCTIDRATIDETRIGRGTKIDNLVQIAHNVHIGEHCQIAAQVGVSGRTIIGPWCTIGGQAGFQGGIRIGASSVIGARSAVFGNLPEKSRVSGYPAKPHRQAMRVLALTWKLPELTEKIKALESEIKRLKKPPE